MTRAFYSYSQRKIFFVRNVPDSGRPQSVPNQRLGFDFVVARKREHRSIGGTRLLVSAQMGCGLSKETKTKLISAMSPFAAA